MRLFIAVEIDPALARELARVAGELRARVYSRVPRARLTWVAEDRLHFTVRFIGEVDESRASAIARTLELPLPVAPFDLTMESIGTFPASGRPRVIWAGTREGGDQLAVIEREVSARLATLGIPPEEREYSPHLTLARVREGTSLRARDVLEGAPEGPIGTSRIDAITLFQSRLSPKGPTYVRLQRTPLRAG
jgi:RNA 2',3'-cyclic 3'-phosphodiesterase